MTKSDVVVIGGGITGLTAAFEIKKRLPRSSVCLLEASDRLGGIVGGELQDGYTVDLGPHGFIDNGGDTRILVDELGLADELVTATKAAARIYLLCGDRLHNIPATLRDLVTTPLLSVRAKLRLLGEVVVPRKVEEDSVVEFVSRRFGREIAETFAVPAVRGVVGGDANNFSIEGEFPLIKELEREYGSVLIGSVRHQARRHRLDPVATKYPSFKEFGDRLKTFHGGGMQHLADNLGRVLGDSIQLRTRVTSLERDENASWTVLTAGGERLDTKHVFVALPSDATAELVRPHHREIARTLSLLPHPDIRVVALGYQRSQLTRIPDGIGFIATPGRRSDILGAIHASTIFPEQAPAGSVLIRVLAGGSPDSPILSMSDEEATSLVHEDLAAVFGVSGDPAFWYHHLWRRPIPTYPVGHRPRMRALLGSVAELGGLHVAGNSYFGVGVNDCVRDARRAADNVIKELSRTVTLPLP